MAQRVAEPDTWQAKTVVMFTLDLAALSGLTARNLLKVEAHSRLRAFVEPPPDAFAIEQALTRLREEGHLDEGPALAMDLAESLEVLGDPVLRLRVTRAPRGKPERTVLFDSDGIVAVTAVTDGSEIVVSPALTFEEVADGVVKTLIAPELQRDGARVELTGAEAGLIAVLAPHALAGELTAPFLCSQLASLGATLDEKQVVLALDELCSNGWLRKDADRYVPAQGAEARFAPLLPDVVIDLVMTVFGIDREMSRTHRYHRRGAHLWRLDPFIAGHDAPPAEDASEDVQINTLLGLSYVPQSREMVEEHVASVLGLAPRKRR